MKGKLSVETHILFSFKACGMFKVSSCVRNTKKCAEWAFTISSSPLGSVGWLCSGRGSRRSPRGPAPAPGDSGWWPHRRSWRRKQDPWTHHSSERYLSFLKCRNGRMKQVKKKKKAWKEKNFLITAQLWMAQGRFTKFKPYCSKKCVYVLGAQSCLTLCEPLDWGRQAPLSMGFPRQEYCCGVPCPPPWDPRFDAGIEPR